MNEKKRRRRTGCLTCRRRRVRCDEGKPACERCNAANVECAGYEPRRQIESRSAPATTTSASPSSTTPVLQTIRPTFTLQDTDTAPTVYPKFRIDNLPLISIPSNPRSNQRPHPRARDILAYHQFLFRTLPLLFLDEHLIFWRDRLCEEAWETEYIFLTITAIGGLHRAVLMMSTHDDDDKSRGLDTKVIAVQTYTEALARLSEQTKAPVQSLDVYAGSLVLLAFFECLFGNIPAAIGHTNEATHYLLHMQIEHPHKSPLTIRILRSAICRLANICQVILPIPSLEIVEELDHRMPHAAQPQEPGPTLIHTNPAKISLWLQQLSDFADGHSAVKELVWDPLLMYERSEPPSAILAFQERLADWTRSHMRDFPGSDAQTTIIPRIHADRESVETITIPPPVYANSTSDLCLFVAACNFYWARTYWALSLLTEHHESEQYCVSAYRHIYEAMRATATIVGLGEGVNEDGEGYLACEMLDIGLLPMLHILGQTCPRPSWLRWMMEQLNFLMQEGLFSGQIFAKSLNALYTFEVSNNLDSAAMLDMFPSPALRVISVLLPEQDGQSYVAYYARPGSADSQGKQYQYHLLGHARWSQVRRGGTIRPDIEMYSEHKTLAVPFTREWLSRQKVCQEWTTWSTGVGFSLDRALRDHISGSCLENAVYEHSAP